MPLDQIRAREVASPTDLGWANSFVQIGFLLILIIFGLVNEDISIKERYKFLFYIKLHQQCD